MNASLQKCLTTFFVGLIISNRLPLLKELGNHITDYEVLFEKVIMDYCVRKRKLIEFNAKRKDYSLQDLWNKVKGDV
jgi:hypothetical protein